MFRKTTEAEAYLTLHEQGHDAFDAAYPRLGGDLLNDWHDDGKVRITHTPEGFRVRTFQKYARAASQRLAQMI